MVEELQNLNPLEVILNWCKIITEKNNSYSKMESIGYLSKRELSYYRLPISIKARKILTVYENICSIQYALLSSSELLPHELFCKINPFVAVYYSTLRESEKTVLDSFNCLQGNLSSVIGVSAAEAPGFEQKISDIKVHSKKKFSHEVRKFLSLIDFKTKRMDIENEEILSFADSIITKKTETNNSQSKKRKKKKSKK